MKKNLKNGLKKTAAIVMMACMLFSLTKVGGNYGIMPFGMTHDIDEIL